jgi:methoxymalonate biosynthesis protein
MSDIVPSPCLAVLGAGAVGVNIAALAVGHGLTVVLVAEPDSQAHAQARVHARLELLREHGAVPADREPGLVRVRTRMPVDIAVDAVFEAVSERAVLKAKALSEACSVIEPGTPVISCSSGIPVDELADWAGRPQDVVGVLLGGADLAAAPIEVARGRHTSDEIMAAARELLSAIGLEPVEVLDGPGRVAARVLYPMINAAARLVGENAASIDDIDRLLSWCFGPLCGPLRCADRIGIDTLVDALEQIHARTGDPGCVPCATLQDKLASGELGVKSGRGFYAYED